VTAPRRLAAALTLPPAPAELAAVAAFERDVRERGEPQARLRHTVTHASATLRAPTVPPAVVMGVKVARRVQGR
jgi:hypothetical protein